MRQFVTIRQGVITESKWGTRNTRTVVDGLAVDVQQFRTILAVLGHPMTKTGKVLFGGWDQFVECWDHAGLRYSLSVAY